MIKINKKLKVFICLIFLPLFSSCSNVEKLKDNKTNTETTTLEKVKQAKQDSLENLKKEIRLLKKKRDSLSSKSKENYSNENRD